MKNKKSSSEHEDEHQLEILKAVAQAWHGHSGNCRPTNEYDAHLRNFQTKPSRFKLEAMNKSSLILAKRVASSGSGNWDFKQSLLDSYEIVSMAKRLERGMILDDDPFSGLDNQTHVHRRRRESKNSLRNLFNRLASRRFNDNDLSPPEDNSNQF